MKFLTISTVNDTMLTLPPAVSRQLAEANLNFVKQQRQAGKILELYTIPGWRRTVAISQSDSAEELVQTFNQMPGSGFMSFEIYPLADFDESMKYVIDALKKAEEQFPSA